MNKVLKQGDPSIVKEFSLERLDDEIGDLQRLLTTPDQRIGFCHNDLQYGNIMISEKDDSVTIIVGLATTVYIIFLCYYSGSDPYGSWFHMFFHGFAYNIKKLFPLLLHARR